MAPINFITSIFCDRGRGDGSEEPFILNRVPNYVNDFQAYVNGMKRKLGILFVYNENELEFLRGFVERILSLDFLMEILVRIMKLIFLILSKCIDCLLIKSHLILIKYLERKLRDSFNSFIIESRKSGT